MDPVKVGQQVRLMYSRARGIVREVDKEYHAARVELNEGGEPWVLLDEIEVVGKVWDRRRTHYSIGERRI